jgi:hypothetical protein
MPYPNSNTLNIVIPQTSASLQGGQAPFVETIISGSRLILQTDSFGFLTGSSDINVNSITASNISASGYISSSNLYVKTNITDAGTLTVVGASTLAGLTGTTATFSGLVSASAGLTASAIQDAGTLTVVGNSTLSNVFATNVTASNISASGFITASSIYDTGTLTVLGNSTLTNVFATNITASNLSASNKIVASEITASNELFVGTGPAYRTYGEASVPENLARLYVSGSATIFSKYATLNLATSASDAGAQSSILFSRLASSGSEAVLSPRMQLGTESGSTDLRVYAYYSATDPDIVNQAAGANIVAGTRAIFKQSGYFGVGNFISYGAGGGASTTYVSSLPGYAGIVGPDAMLTILPMDSASFGSAGSKSANRNILNIMSYDTSSIMFISGSDGYVLLGKNTTDGINRLQVAGNVSASAYTGSSANFTNLIATNITSSNISASGNISANTLTVIGNSTLSTVFATNITASNISASSNISSSTLYVVGNGTINGDLRVNGNSILGDSLSDVNTSSGSLRVLNTTNNDQLTYTNGALVVDGGVGIGKNLFVSGSMLVGGDFTVFGSSSVVYISSSTVIINDNIIQLNAFFPYERYAGFEVFDSGSNQRSASLLWDGKNDNWITVDQVNSASNIIVGPTSSFALDNITGFTTNRIPKAYDATGITDSLVSDDGTTLRYTGNVISASSITSSYGTVTYITGALVTYVTGSFNILQVSTGSSPGTGQVPSSPTNTGFVGQITVDNNFIYVYTGNIWKRVPISNWAP